MYDATGVLAPFPPFQRAKRPRKFQQSPLLWLQRIHAYLRSPFDLTMVLDSDAFPCPGVERLFDKLARYDHVTKPEGDTQPFGGTRGCPQCVQPLRSARDALSFVDHFHPRATAQWEKFRERNGGMQVLATARPQVVFAGSVS